MNYLIFYAVKFDKEKAPRALFVNSADADAYALQWGGRVIPVHITVRYVESA